MSLRVKICGLTRARDAEVAAEAGADYLGAILVPESPRCITPDRAREIRLAAGLPLVLVVANLPTERIVEAADRAGASVIQLHGDETPADLAALRRVTDRELWKAVRVRPGDPLSDAISRGSESADGILLDGWHPRRRGGTGTPFDWDALARMRSEWPERVELIAAGGLTPANVEEAIRTLRPHVVDVSSGVEVRPGVKNPELIRDFVAAARRGRPDHDPD